MRDLFASLRFRLVVLVSLALLPILGLMLYTHAEQRQLAVVEAQESALRLARLAASDQERLVEGTRQLLVALAQLPAIQTQDAEACNQLMADLLQQYTQYENLGAASPEGDIFCAAIRTTPAPNVADRPWFQRAVETQDFVAGDYILARITGRPALSAGYPVLDEAGQLRAVLFAGIDLGWLDQFVAEAQLPAGSTLTVVDSSGAILTRYPSPEEWRGKPLPASVMEPILAGGEAVSVAQGVDGVQRLYAFARLCCSPTSDVYVRVGLTEAVAFGEANRTLTRNLVTLGLITLLVFAVGWAGAHTLVLRPLEALLQAIRRFEAGDSGARVGRVNGGGELGRLAQAFDQMSATIEARGKERDRSEEALRQEQSARAALLDKTISAQEEERRRIARELHDETSQDLAALMLSLDTCALGLPDKGSSVDEHLQRAKTIAETMMTNIRRLINDLRPSLLDDLGLVPAILWYAEQRLKPLGITVSFQCDRMDARLSPSLETALFRITQEAITNVVRHAEATEVRVILEVDNREVYLAIQDNGTGFEVPVRGAGHAAHESLGLRGIQERAAMLGGGAEIRSTPGEGTTLAVEIPLVKEVVGSVQDPRAAD